MRRIALRVRSLCAIVLLLAACQTVSSTPPASIGPQSPTTTATPTATPTTRTTPSTRPTQVTPTSVTPTSSATSTSTPTPTPTLAAGATQIAASDGMILVYVPAGPFRMGSLPEDAGADADEFPQRTIQLDAFWIDQTEISNARFAAFLSASGGPASGAPAWYPAHLEAAQILPANGRWQVQKGLENLPVIEVTWHGAQAYCAWAGRRLPSEAEWEKAARGPDGNIFAWGNEISCGQALFANCGQTQAAAVGSYPDGASPYGALDMTGNVWEWVADWYAPEAYAATPSANPTGPPGGVARVLRGGSFDFDAKHNRAANRRNDGPANSSYDYGFRCAVSANP